MPSWSLSLDFQASGASLCTKGGILPGELVEEGLITCQLTNCELTLWVPCKAGEPAHGVQGKTHWKPMVLGGRLIVRQPHLPALGAMGVSVLPGTARLQHQSLGNIGPSPLQAPQHTTAKPGRRAIHRISPAAALWPRLWQFNAQAGQIWRTARHTAAHTHHGVERRKRARNGRVNGAKRNLKQGRGAEPIRSLPAGPKSAPKLRSARRSEFNR